MHPTMDPQDITGLVLAGGQVPAWVVSTRGLNHSTASRWSLHALRPAPTQVGSMLVNANRHLDTYRTLVRLCAPTHRPTFPARLPAF